MRRRTVALVVLFLLVVVGNARGQVQYTVTNLGTLPGYTDSSYAAGINNSGQVVGWSETSGDEAEHAFLYSSGAMKDLGTLGGPSGHATGINDGGQIVGYSLNSVGDYHAFIYSGGAMQDVPPLPGSQGTDCWAYAISPNGQIVGMSRATPGGNHAFLYDGSGPPQDLGTLGGQTAYPNGINASGQIVGVSQTSGNTAWDAFLYSGGIMYDLGTSSNASAINASGQIVGHAATSGSNSQAFLHSGNSPINMTMDGLGTLGGANSNALAINSTGQIVGDADTSGGADHAFLYSGGSMYDLNNLIRSNPGWTLEEATGINDKGQICGYGINPNGQTGAFLLTPTPEPSTLALLATGALGLVGHALRRRRAAEGTA
jgi:probable HAF family extracellular repeat protein